MKTLTISIVTPAPPRSRHGNRVTALRWSRILRNLGHATKITQAYAGQPVDLLIALHARRSHAAIRDFARVHPDVPLVVALTGTDLYSHLRTDRLAKESLELASRIVVLQARAPDMLSPHLRRKTRVIYQSVKAVNAPRTPRRNVFEVCVIGHLRPVKDPFRAAMASKLLPDDSRVRIVHIGAALSREMADRARREIARNPRYEWLGELPHWKVLRRLARSRALALTSKSEGGANVVSEAIAASVPIISSRIDGSIGMLGEDYPAYFPVGDTPALAALLTRLENDSAFRQQLARRSAKRAPLFAPAREQNAWKALIEELARRSHPAKSNDLNLR